LATPESASGVASAYERTARRLDLVGEVMTLRPAARGASVVEAAPDSSRLTESLAQATTTL
jgi:hypothetical protein